MSQEQQQLQCRKVAILGSAPSLSQLTYEEGWEYWSLTSNLGNPILKIKPDRWFELHGQDFLVNTGDNTRAELEVLSNMENMWMMEPSGKATRFPREDVLNLRKGLQYYTSSIAWIIGLAILEKVDTIGLWGVDCFLKIEYERQRPCIENLIGYAQGLGINIIIPSLSPLCKGALYCDDFAYELQLRSSDNRDAIEKAKYQLAFLEGEKHCLDSLIITKG